MADDDTDVGLGDQSDAQDLAELAQFRQTAPGVYSPTPAPAAPQQALTPPAYKPAPAFNPSRAVPVGDPFSFPPPPKEPTPSSLWKDGTTAAWNSALGMGKDLAGVASFVTNQITSDPDIRSYVGSWQSNIADRMKANIDAMGDADKEAMGASVMGWLPGRLGQDKQGNRIPSPTDVNFGRYLALTAADFIPQGLSFILPEALGARFGLWAASKMGVATKALDAAGEVTGLTKAGAVASNVGGSGATALTFGTQNAGAAFDKISDLLKNATKEEMMTNPAYAQLLQDGQTDDQARATLRDKAAPILLAGLTGAVAGAGTGALLTRGVLGAGERGWMARAGIGAGEGGATMGAQGAANSAITQQAATGKVDLPSVMADAVASGVQGAAFGVAGGLLHGKGQPEEKPPPPNPDVDPDVGAAMLQIEGPEKQLLLTHDTSGQQALPSPTDTSINVPAGPGQITPPPPPTGPVSFGDVNTAPVTRGPEPPAAPAPAPPPAAQAAIDVSRGAGEPPPPTTPPPPPGGPPGGGPPGGGPPGGGPPIAPTGPRPSQGMTRQQLSDALTGQVDPKALKAMSAKDMATRYDKLAPASEPTTVVKAPEGPPTSEPAAPLAEGAAAPPPSPSGVGSLPAAAEAAAKPTFLDSAWVKQAGAVDGGYSMRKGGEALADAGKQALDAGHKVELVVDGGKKTVEITRVNDGMLTDTQGQRWGSMALATDKTGKEGLRITPRGELTAKNSTGVRPEGGTAPGPDEHPVQATTAPPTPEARPVASGEAPVDPREAALEKVATARRALKLPRGSSIEKLTNQAWAEIQTLISHSSGSPKDLATLISKFVQPRSIDTPETLLARRGVGNRVYQEFTGKKLGLIRTPAAVREETTPEVEQVRREEQTRGGAEARTPEAIEAKATGGGEGESAGQTMGLEVVHKNVTRATDRDRVARDLINKVLDPSDPMTVQDADRQYGKPVPGPGRPRREGLKTFADAIDKEIQRVETPGAAQKLRDQLRTNELDTSKDEDVREAQSRFLERKLEDFNPARIAQLKDERAKLVDPVGHVADKAALEAEMDRRIAEQGGRARPIEDAPSPPRPSGINPRSSRYVRTAGDQRLGANYERLFRAHDEHDMPLMAHDAARMIAQDPLIRAEQGPLREVAQRFASVLPKDIPIMSIERARAEGRISQEVHDDLLSRRIYGAYDPESRTILQNVNAPRETGTHAETALHEMSHAISWHYLDHLERHDPQHTDLRMLKLIRYELRQHVISEYEAGRLSSAEIQRLFKAVSNIDELHTQMFTDPVVHGFAAGRTASPEFRAEAATLGQASPPGASVWRSFANWVRKAVGQPVARSASEQTLFDHIIRPMADIQARAAEYNKRLLPEDPVLRAHAEPLYDAATSSLTDRARDVLSNVDVRGLGDRARRVILQGATSDGIVARHTRMLPGLERWRASYEAIARSGKQFADTYADTVKDLTARYNRLDDPKALGQLMTDATLAKAHLGPDATNTHLTTDAEKAALAALQARYARLPAPTRDLYNEFKDTYAAWYKQKRAAQLGALVRGFMPDATDEQHAALTKALSRKSTLDNFLKDMDNSPIAKAFGDQWQANRKLARGIAQVHNQGFVQGDYFPLRRFGNYVVRYGDKMTPGDYGVEMFGSRRKAEERRAELAAAGMEPYQVSDKRESDMRDIVPYHPAVDELTASLASRGYPEAAAKEIRDQLNGILLEHATHSAASRAAQGMRRKGVLGASADQARILPDEFVNTQAGIGHLEHGLERVQAISHMRTVELPALESQNYKGRAGDAITAAAVLREVEQRSTAIDPDSVLQSIGARANTFSFAQSLMSPSHMLTSSMEAHTNGMALLGARHGVFKAGAALTRALAQASPMLKTGAIRTIQAVKGELKSADWNLPEMLKQRMIDKGSNKTGMAQLFKSLEDANLIDHTMLKDIQQQANPGSRAGGVAYNAWARFRDFSAASAHAVDVMNKVAIAKAAFDLEYAKTKDVNKSVEYATKIARTAMPNYNIGNKARIATSHGTLGALGSPLFQFKNYGLHMYTVLANLAQEGMHGENRWEARKAFALMLATHAAMAGVLGLPIADALRYIGGAYDLITGASKPHNYQNDLRQGIASVFGPTLGDVISGGLPHALGFDVSHRVGLANLGEIPEMASFDKDGVGQVLLGMALGASGENLQSAWGGVMKILQGDIPGGVQAAIPRPFRDVMKAGNLAERGVVTQRGRTILPADKISPWDVALQAVGFQPSRVTEARAGSAAVQEAHDEAQAEHTRLTNRWLQASPAERQNVQQEINQYNQSPGSLGFRITRDQLLRDQREQQKRSRLPGAFGLRLPAKGAQQLIQAGSFANVQ